MEKNLDFKNYIKKFDIIVNHWKRHYRDYPFPAFFYDLSLITPLKYIAATIVPKDYTDIFSLYSRHTNLGGAISKHPFTEEDIQDCYKFAEYAFYPYSPFAIKIADPLNGELAYYLFHGMFNTYQPVPLSPIGFIPNFDYTLWKKNIKKEINPTSSLGLGILI